MMPVNCELEPKNLENQLTLAKAKIIVCDELNIGDAIGSYNFGIRNTCTACKKSLRDVLCME